jgi:hypothetical protein
MLAALVELASESLRAATFLMERWPWLGFLLALALMSMTISRACYKSMDTVELPKLFGTTPIV